MSMVLASAEMEALQDQLLEGTVWGYGLKITMDQFLWEQVWGYGLKILFPGVACYYSPQNQF